MPPAEKGDAISETTPCLLIDRFSYNPDQPLKLACRGPLSSVELAKELLMSWSEFHSKPIIYKRNMVC